MELTDFDIPVPAGVQRIIDGINSLASYCRTDAWTEICDCELSGNGSRYTSTPPEFFPVINLLVDFSAIGCIVYDPQAPQPDYQWGYFCPADSSGVTYWADSSQEALEDHLRGKAWIAQHMGRSVDPLILKASKKYKMNLTPAGIAKHRRRKKEHRAPFAATPAGWHFLPSSDGIGVLAPRDAFAKVTAPRTSTDIAGNLDLANKYLASSHPATALFILREAYWHHRRDEGTEPVSAAMADAYRRLNRPTLATITETRQTKLTKQIADLKRHPIKDPFSDP